MVGGQVREILKLEDRVWINVVDPNYPTTPCAVYVQRTPEAERVKVGDGLWWQAGNAYWNPPERYRKADLSKPSGVDYDIAIPLIGHSGALHPAQALMERSFSSR